MIPRVWRALEAEVTSRDVQALGLMHPVRVASADREGVAWQHPRKRHRHARVVRRVTCGRERPIRLPVAIDDDDEVEGTVGA